MQTTSFISGQQPVVSVVIATYRASGHLAEAIRSALGQTLVELEVIVSDDGNDTAVAELVRSFSDRRLVYRSNARRLGPAGNHWEAFAAARGEFIAVLNHDDLQRPSFAARLAAVLTTLPGVVLAFCDHGVVDVVGCSLDAEADALSRRWGRTGLPVGIHRDAASLVVRGTVPSAIGAMFRRCALPELPDFDPAGAYDLYLSAKLAETGQAFYFVNERLTAWRIHPGQLTRQADQAWARGTLGCWEIMSRAAAFDRESQAVRRGLGRSHYRVGRLAWAAGDSTSALVEAVAATHACPTNWRCWALRLLATGRSFLRGGRRRLSIPR